MNETSQVPLVKAFFDDATNTVSYVVSDRTTRQCAVIDPVLDFDMASGRTSTVSADRIVDHVKKMSLEVRWILETHVHADHLSAAPYIKSRLGGHTGVGELITEVQAIFRDVFNLGQTFPVDGRQFDRLLKDDERLGLGELDIRVVHTPGHTPACVTYVIGDSVFVGDTLFMPDFGTARVDFPGGDAATLYRSIRKILDFPDETRVFLCHDYKATGRDVFAWETTVARQRAENIHVHSGISEQDFIDFRTRRDRQLSVPKLILPSIQVNIRAGHLPDAEDNGGVYLKIPVDAL